MILPDIRLHTPDTLEEACSLLRRYGRSARVMAGGTDLLIDLRKGRIAGVEHLVSLRKLDGLRTIEDEVEKIRIGALVTPNVAARDPSIIGHFPAFLDAVRVMAAEPIRNMATIGGNIAGAVPCSDFVPLLVAAGSEVVLSNGAGERTLALEDFITGPRETVCREDEVLTHVLVPKPAPRTGLAYEKFMLREANGVAVAGACALLGLDDEGAKVARCRIVLTAVAPVPVAAEEAARCLLGGEPSKDRFSKAGALARKAARPITDIRGSAEYRLDLVEVLTRRALEKAAARASGAKNRG